MLNAKTLEGGLIDMEKLLAPVAGPLPTGEFLRYDGTYDTIQEDRREDDATLEQGIWKTKLKKADWAAVSRTCRQALETRSKDLQIAAWLTESLLQQHGLGGLRCGLEAIHQLCLRFWKDVHPRVEEGGMEYRVAPFQWINEKLPLRLKLMPMTQPTVADTPTFSYADWEKANRLENLAKRSKSDKISDQSKNLVTTESILLNASLTPPTYFCAFIDELDAILALSRTIENFLDEHCGKEAPGFSEFRKILEALRLLVVQLGGEKLEQALAVAREKPSPEQQLTVKQSVGAEQIAGAATAVATDSQEVKASRMEQKAIDASGPAETSSSASAVGSRAEAYRRLNEAADYLLRIEPHSPTPYLVKRAVAWGDMSLDQLINELVHDQANREFIFNLLGFRPDLKEGK
jgi:type VI secretion system ImpA family protein